MNTTTNTVIINTEAEQMMSYNMSSDMEQLAADYIRTAQKRYLSNRGLRVGIARSKSKGMFDVTVSTFKDSKLRISKTVYNIFAGAAAVETAIIEASKQAIAAIDAHSGTVKLSLTMNPDLGDADECLIDDLVYGLKSEYDATLTLGSTTADIETGEVTIVLYPNELGYFQDLVFHSGSHLIMAMEKYTADENGNEMLGVWSTIHTLMSPLPFFEWNDVMQTALLQSVFNSIHGVTLTAIELSGERLGLYAPKPIVVSTADQDNADFDEAVITKTNQ